MSRPRIGAARSPQTSRPGADPVRHRLTDRPNKQTRANRPGRLKLIMHRDSMAIPCQYRCRGQPANAGSCDPDSQTRYTMPLYPLAGQPRLVSWPVHLTIWRTLHAALDAAGTAAYKACMTRILAIIIRITCPAL
ncbi:hypothetical protein PEL8287_00653 [Roseovarius litorisediminis]|uniref:Uncharacterized protein n=1 Tax=Roseovarius litorisediminis TaxID=1312363 RepID=A0A1Y5RFH0_9RHOB|nr:hypothetical protein PEL8287_00653 [Roseovarius litorisediminis]